jgi:hypothetical protein
MARAPHPPNRTCPLPHHLRDLPPGEGIWPGRRKTTVIYIAMITLRGLWWLAALGAFLVYARYGTFAALYIAIAMAVLGFINAIMGLGCAYVLLTAGIGAAFIFTRNGAFLVIARFAAVIGLMIAVGVGGPWPPA